MDRKPVAALLDREFPVFPDVWYQSSYVENVMVNTENVIVVTFWEPAALL